MVFFSFVDVATTMNDSSNNFRCETLEEQEYSVSLSFLKRKTKYDKKIQSLREKVEEIETLDCYLKSQNLILSARNEEVVQGDKGFK